MARILSFAAAIDDALSQAMAEDPRIHVWGEDVALIRRDLLVRFGPERVLAAPISEAAFVGAAVTAALGGLRPVVEVMLVDFVGPALDAIFNHAAKVAGFSGGTMSCPLIVRAACGGGYGDGGQHEQSLWGWFGHIPGLAVVVPAFPEDAGSLLLGALAHGGPVVFLEHKLLSKTWLELLGSGARTTISFDIPAAGAEGPVPERWTPVPLGKAVVRRDGTDLTIAGVGVGVHRALEAAETLAREGMSACVLDLRTVAPLDAEAVRGSVSRTGRLLVVDEDYTKFGLSGELAAVCLEAGLSFKYARVGVDETIPFARSLEDAVLPNAGRIAEAARRCVRA
jgi:pyruvate dehydrogenase E1 component beta subunit